LDRCSGPSR